MARTALRKENVDNSLQYYTQRQVNEPKPKLIVENPSELVGEGDAIELAMALFCLQTTCQILILILLLLYSSVKI